MKKLLTYCNVYASDLARSILFPGTFTSGDNYAPWGKHQAAAYLHDVLKDNTNGHFKALTFNDAWKYTNAGYVVYLTAYSKRYYNGETSNKYKYSGHIVTCYQTDNYATNIYLNRNIIQAGGTVGLMSFVNGWGSDGYGNNHAEIKANLYLGYIIK